MAEGDVRQYFVRNEQGAIWGPLALPTIELLIDNGVIQGRLQVSEDGINFAFPGRFPHIRDAFPREMWGDVIAPGPSAPAAPPAGAMPPAAQPGVPAVPPVPGAPPMAGPGAVPRGPGAVTRPPVPGAGVPVAGPGAVTRPPVPGAGVPVAGPGATARPAVPGAGAPGPAVTRPPVPGAGVPVATARPGAPAASPGARPVAPTPGAVPPGAPAGAARPPPTMTPGPGVPGAPATAAPRPAAPARPTAPPAVAPATTAAPGTPAAVRTVAAPAQAAAPAPAAAPGPEDTIPASGQLETHSPVRLYGLIAAGNHTGLLSLTLADCTVGIHFRKGNPEFIDSSHPEDALGTWLLQAKLATPEQLQQAEAARGRFGGEMLAALFGLGLLQPASAFTQLAHRAQAILLKGLRAESGSFTFEAKDLPAAKAMPLGNKWAVLSDLVRRIPSTDLRRRLQPVLNLPVMKSNGRVPTGDLRLTPHEVRVLALIDGARSIGQLLNDVPQDAEHLLRLVFLLRELDGVSFAAVRPGAPAAAQATPQAAAKPASPPPAAARAVTQPGAAQAGATPQAAAARAVTQPGTAQTGATPQAAAARAVTQPGAAQAGATPQTAAAKPAAATPQAAAKPAAPAASAAPQAPRPAAPAAKPAAPAPAPAASGAAAATAKPAAPAPAAPAASGAAPDAGEIAALRELAEKMKEQNHFERLGLMADTNGPAVKIAYFKLAKQYHPDTLPPGAPPEMEKLKADIFAYIGDAYRALSDDKSRAAYIEDLKTGGSQPAQVDVEAILKSEDLFRKAGHYIKARKFADAAKLLDEAIQLNAEEPEFYAWRGYARFFTFEDKKVGYNEAYRDIQLCLKKNEKVAAGHYFLGVIAKLCGDNSGAMKHFQRTVEIQPNHIDAQREIRMAQQKK